MLVASLTGPTSASGISGPILFAATTQTLFSAARTGMCRSPSSRANEFRLLQRTWAPRSARQRGVSFKTPSMHEYIASLPSGVSTTGPDSVARSRKSFSWPISTCLSAVPAIRPSGANSIDVPVTRRSGRRTVQLITT